MLKGYKGVKEQFDFDPFETQLNAYSGNPKLQREDLITPVAVTG